jgi:TPR repeat protein
MRQYEKSMAWYLLSASKNNSYAQYNIGLLYHNGNGVPVNYLCALKWYIKSVDNSGYHEPFKCIGYLFECGHGVPLDRYRALECFYRSNDDVSIRRFSTQGIYLFQADIGKLHGITNSLY